MLKRFCLISIIIAFCVACFGVEAVQRKFKFDKIDFNEERVSPQRSTISGLSQGKLQKMGRTKKWGIIEVLYESTPEWADDVELKYYVLLKSDKGKKRSVMLAGDVVYIHVEKGKKHLSSMYVPPQVISRYGKVLRIRVELWYNGVFQDSAKWPKGSKKTPWWTRIKPTYGSIVNRFYTPFEHDGQLEEELIKIK